MPAGYISILSFLAMLSVSSLCCESADNQNVHLRVLRDAYRGFSQPLPTGEMRASFYSPVDGLTHDLYVVWKGEYEYFEITDYHAGAPANSQKNGSLNSAGPKHIRSVVGPDGTLCLHERLHPGRANVANIDRRQRKRESSSLVPHPHTSWYQLTWAGQTLWSEQLQRMTTGELEVAVQEETLPGGDTQLQITNVRSGFSWHLTYSPSKGGRIVNYGPDGSEYQTTYDWEADDSNRWFLREYRHFPANRNAGDSTERQPFVIHVHQFSFEPTIDANRFRFASMPLKDGTIIYEEGANKGRFNKTIVGADSAGRKQPTMSDFKRLSNMLRTRGYGKSTSEK
jgi:hypothetical protein